MVNEPQKTAEPVAKVKAEEDENTELPAEIEIENNSNLTDEQE